VPLLARNPGDATGWVAVVRRITHCCCCCCCVFRRMQRKSSHPSQSVS